MPRRPAAVRHGMITQRIYPLRNLAGGTSVRVRCTIPIAVAIVSLAAAPIAAQHPTAVRLQEAIRMAQRVQPAIVEASGRVRDAEAQVRSGYGAFLPRITAGTIGGYSAFGGPARVDPITGALISGNSASTSVSLGLSASVDLFTGFRRGADIRAAKAQRVAAEAALLDEEAQIAFATTDAFLRALAAAEMIALQEASVRRATDQLKISVAKLRLGAATTSDSLRSVVALGAAQLQVLDASVQLADAEANLARLIGLEGRVSAVADSSFEVHPDLDTAAIREEALAQSPGIRRTEAAAHAAEAALSSTRSAYWPSLALSGSTGYSGTRIGTYQLFSEREISLALRWNLFDGFDRERTITNRASALTLTQATAAEARRLASASLTTLFTQLVVAQRRIAITRTSVAAATADLQQQQQRYRLGSINIVDVLTSQENLNRAEASGLDARFDYLRAKARIQAVVARPL